MTSHNLALNAPKQHLRQLTAIRTLLLVFLWCGFLASFWVENIQLPVKDFLAVLCVFTIVHVLTFFRLRSPLVVTQIEFFIQLLIDVVCLNFLFFLSGGATNPFISYLLVLVCISAATLPWRFTWFITSLCVIAYSILLFFHVSLPIFAMDQAHNHSQLSWHIIGMWFNFFISAILITYFVVKMAKSLRQQEEKLNELREDELRNEQVIAVATLAAGAAHEINTPLATMTVLLAELQNQYKENPSLQSDLVLLSKQVAHCAETLKQMVQNSSASTQGQYRQQTIIDYCNAIIDRWQLMRPNINFSLAIADDISQKCITCDSRLDHTIINLLNNAADASPEKIIINITIDQIFLKWKIIDEGVGIASNSVPFIGKILFTTKPSGLGLGMLLTHATIKRYGGNVVQTANTPQGTITEISLPLDAKQTNF